MTAGRLWIWNFVEVVLRRGCLLHDYLRTVSEQRTCRRRQSWYLFLTCAWRRRRCLESRTRCNRRGTRHLELSQCVNFVSRLHRPNVSIYKQSVHGITVTILLIISWYLSSNKYNGQKMQVIYRWAFSVAPALCHSVTHTQKVEGHVPLLNIWLRRLWFRAA